MSDRCRLVPAPRQSVSRYLPPAGPCRPDRDDSTPVSRDPTDRRAVAITYSPHVSGDARPSVRWTGAALDCPGCGDTASNDASASGPTPPHGRLSYGLTPSTTPQRPGSHCTVLVDRICENAVMYREQLSQTAATRHRFYAAHIHRIIRVLLFLRDCLSLVCLLSLWLHISKTRHTIDRCANYQVKCQVGFEQV